MQGLQTSIWNNQLKTWLLIILFPVFLGLAIFGVFFFGKQNLDSNKAFNSYETSRLEQRLTLATQETGAVLIVLGPILVIWLIISFIFQRQLMFSFSGARVVTRKEEPEIYNVVENLCISRGLPTPRIGIIETESLNAFALGWRSKDAWVVFTRGLLNSLERHEIEAVAAHELTHIINRDSLLMLVVVLYIGAISLIGEILIRSKRGGSKDKNILPLIGLVLMLLGYLVYPLIRFAISRKREFLADAGSVILTKDNQAMISALRKIDKNPKVNLGNNEMSAMFIANPLESLGNWFQTHPSIEERIEALQHY